MSQNNIMDVITTFTTKMVQELNRLGHENLHYKEENAKFIERFKQLEHIEETNKRLKQELEVVKAKNKQLEILEETNKKLREEFASLNSRHTEIKQVYVEAEQEIKNLQNINSKLMKEKEEIEFQLSRKQEIDNNIVSQVESYLSYILEGTIQNTRPPQSPKSQKPAHREAKKVKRVKYESESETDESDVDFGKKLPVKRALDFKQEVETTPRPSTPHPESKLPSSHEVSPNSVQLVNLVDFINMVNQADTCKPEDKPDQILSSVLNGKEFIDLLTKQTSVNTTQNKPTNLLPNPLVVKASNGADIQVIPKYFLKENNSNCEFPTEQEFQAFTNMLGNLFQR
jgi:hypothetical protein